MPGASPGDGERVTEEEAIRALSADGGTARAEYVRAMEIVDEVLRRMGDDPGLRIGSINVFNDEIQVGEGDFTIGAGGGRKPAGRRATDTVVLLDNISIERRANSYVRPKGFEQALEILTRRRLLVLCGPRGTGREAAALALLIEAADRGRLHLVDSTALLAEGGWLCGPGGTGFAVAPLEPPAARRLDDVWLEKTAKRLSEADNYMVVVTGAPTGALAMAGSRADFAFEELGVPDAMAVLSRRAHAAIEPTQSARLTSLLSSMEVADLVQADNSPRFAARAAVVLAEALNEGKDVALTIRALRNPAAQVQAWFDRYDGPGEPDYRQLVLPIAVSVLEDSGYLAVTDAATDLYRALLPGEEGPPPLRFRRSLIEHQHWIQLTSGEGVPELHGQPRTGLLRFRNPLLRAEVLQYTWIWLDGIRPALNGWLGELARQPDVDVRARAATSAGLLATLDFHYALHNFIYPWAAGRSAAVRACAAIALAIPGRSFRYEAQVWELLRQWAAYAPERSGSRLASTAAEAAGSVLGRHRPGDALSVLREVLNRDEWDSLTVLFLAVLNLAENGCAAEVLTALSDWSEPDDGSAPVIKALAVFALVARTPMAAETARDSPRPAKAEAPPRGPSRLTGTAVSPHRNVTEGSSATVGGRPDGGGAEGTSPRRDAPAHDRSWPVVLTEVGKHHDVVRDLWGRALAAKPVRPLALEALRYWLELADEDARALTPVSRVIYAIAGLGGKHPNRIEYYLERWAHDPNQPLRAARRLLRETSASPR